MLTQRETLLVVRRSLALDTDFLHLKVFADGSALLAIIAIFLLPIVFTQRCSLAQFASSLQALVYTYC